MLLMQRMFYFLYNVQMLHSRQTGYLGMYSEKQFLKSNYPIEIKIRYNVF